MPVLFTNNASTTLASGIAAGATSITVASGQGALFPVITGSNFFYATLANTSNVLEIVKVTARTGDTMTVTRGQDGTTATAYNIGDKFELRPTAAALAWKVDQDFTGTMSGAITWSAAQTFNGTISGTGISSYLSTTLASPPAIGGTAAAAGSFTTLSASSTVSGTGFSTYLASPPAIGGTAAAAGSFTTLSASSTVSGTGFSNYFASPPAIGGTTPAGGRFTFAHTAPVAVTFSATAMAVDCALSNVFTTTFTANVTTAPTFSNLKDGQTINWFITQDATGSRTMTWPTSFKWPGGTASALSTAANAVDLLVGTYRSATGFWYVSLSKAFA